MIIKECNQLKTYPHVTSKDLVCRKKEIKFNSIKK